MGKPYAYLRKSVVRQDDPANSAEAQEAAVRALAQSHGDGELVILADWDRSGRLGRDRRPGYDRLWQAIESGGASAVYSYSMSRLARSVSELSRLFETCTAKGIPVRLMADVVDTSTASGRMTATILASVAQFESDVAGERLRAALAAKSARGDRIGTVRFYGEGQDDDLAAVLAAFGEAGSYSGAAKLLNERGVKPRQSKRGWWPSAVSVVIRRSDPTVLARHPTKGVRAGGSDFILARLLRCPTCGTLLTGTRDRVAAARAGRVRYSCRLGTAWPHPRISISEHLIMPAIVAEAARLRTPDAVEMGQDEPAKRADLEARRARIVDLYESGIIDRGDRDRRLAAVQAGLEALQERATIVAIPSIDWSTPPRNLNVVLRALWRSITLDPVTFEPIGFDWTVPEWRAAENDRPTLTTIPKPISPPASSHGERR